MIEPLGNYPVTFEIFDVIYFRDNVCWCNVRKVILDSMCGPSFTVVLKRQSLHQMLT